jgi:hypothetical protein
MVTSGPVGVRLGQGAASFPRSLTWRIQKLAIPMEGGLPFPVIWLLALEKGPILTFVLVRNVQTPPTQRCWLRSFGSEKLWLLMVGGRQRR